MNLEWIGKLPKSLFVAVSLVLIALISFTEFQIGEDISAYIFYSAPIFLSVWYAGLAAGIFIAILCTLTWMGVDFYEGHASYHAILYWNAIVRVVFFLAMAFILNALKSAFEKEKELAHKDPLTGVANRRTFFDFGRLEIDRARRYKRPLTFAYIDLDDFKAINDVFGHQIGDDLLLVVAQTLRINTRITDLIARLGGDEFVVLLTETGEQAAQEVLRKLQDRLCDSMRAHHWEVSFSIGAVTYLVPPQTVDEMIHKADRLMYSAKQTGKNRIQFETNAPVS